MKVTPLPAQPKTGELEWSLCCDSHIKFMKILLSVIEVKIWQCT